MLGQFVFDGLNGGDQFGCPNFVFLEAFEIGLPFLCEFEIVVAQPLFGGSDICNHKFHQHLEVVRLLGAVFNQVAPRLQSLLRVDNVFERGGPVNQVLEFGGKLLLDALEQGGQVALNDAQI